MHTFIGGQSECGKTILAMAMARELKRAGKPVAVCDPLGDPEWLRVKPDFHTENVGELHDYLQAKTGHYAFVDECGAAFNEGRDNTYAWLTTQSRHWGHSVTLISQRSIQVPKTMRDQTRLLCLFQSSRDDGKTHAEEWNKDQLTQCHKLPQFVFLKADRIAHCSRWKIVRYKDVVPDGVASSSDHS